MHVHTWMSQLTGPPLSTWSLLSLWVGLYHSDRLSPCELHPFVRVFTMDASFLVTKAIDNEWGLIKTMSVDEYTSVQITKNVHHRPNTQVQIGHAYAVPHYTILKKLPKAASKTQPIPCSSFLSVQDHINLVFYSLHKLDIEVPPRLLPKGWFHQEV